MKETVCHNTSKAIKSFHLELYDQFGWGIMLLKIFAVTRKSLQYKMIWKSRETSEEKVEQEQRDLMLIGGARKEV